LSESHPVTSTEHNEPTVPLQPEGPPIQPVDRTNKSRLVLLRHKLPKANNDEAIERQGDGRLFWNLAYKPGLRIVCDAVRLGACPDYRGGEAERRLEVGWRGETQLCHTS